MFVLFQKHCLQESGCTLEASSVQVMSNLEQGVRSGEVENQQGNDKGCRGCGPRGAGRSAAM